MITPNMKQKALSLLLFNDESSKLVRQALPLEMWAGDPGIYALAGATYDFIDTYQKAPGIHALDLVMGLRIGGDDKDNDTKKDLLGLVKNIKGLSGVVTQQYILDSISQLQKEHSIKKAILGGMEKLDQGDIEGAEQFVLEQMKNRAVLFAPAKKMADGIPFLREQATSGNTKNIFKIGIPDLDKRGVVPTRGELYAIQGPKKSGKSWALHHIAKQVLLSGKKVLHISLENGWERVIQRYFQAFFAYKNLDDGVTNDLVVPSAGSFDTRRATHSGCLSDIATVNGLQEQLDSMPILRDNLRIEEFPSNTLTIPQLKAYMDFLEVTEQFIPDLLIVDYGSIMAVPDPRQKRLYIGQIHIDLRSIAQQRNIAVVTVVQTNRSGAKEAWADSTDVAEDFSIAATADNLLTLNRTKLEASMGLARIWVSDSRNGQGDFGILIVQNYATGQFCLASQYLDGALEQQLKDFMKRQKQPDENQEGGDKEKAGSGKTLFGKSA